MKTNGKKNVKRGKTGYKKLTYNQRMLKKYGTAEEKAIDSHLRAVIKQGVKLEVSKNIENKSTTNITASNSIINCFTDASGNISQFNYFVFNPVNSGVLTISQGVDSQSRIGNQIKLKRYIIKGSLYWDPVVPPYSENSLGNQAQGYIDLYLGRPLNMDNTITNQLPGLYQNGNQTITPQCQILDRTYGINKDYYKIYWHKRYKVGMAGYNTLSGTNSGFVANNDYSINREFGLDVCKHVCKNKTVKYNDGSNTPQDSLLDSLCLFAVGTFPNLDISTTGFTANSTVYFPVRIQCTSYCEYEDA